MRVFDCILFNQEHDMLECRLSEIGDVIDKIIIVESSTTFMGKPKAHGIDLDRFYKWRDKIHYETYERLQTVTRYGTQPTLRYCNRVGVLT